MVKQYQKSLTFFITWKWQYPYTDETAIDILFTPAANIAILIKTVSIFDKFWKNNYVQEFTLTLVPVISTFCKSLKHCSFFIPLFDMHPFSVKKEMKMHHSRLNTFGLSKHIEI